MDLYTSAEVSRITGLSRERVKQYGRQHGLRKIGRSFVYSPEDLKGLKARIGKGGRPKKEETM